MGAGLRLQVQPQQQVVETRVGAEGVKPWMDFERTQTGFASLIGFLQPFKRLILLTKSRINLGKLPRLDILCFRSLFPVIQPPSPVVFMARSRGLCQSCYLFLAGSSKDQISLVGCRRFFVQPFFPHTSN